MHIDAFMRQMYINNIAWSNLEQRFEISLWHLAICECEVIVTSHWLNKRQYILGMLGSLTSLQWFPHSCLLFIKIVAVLVVLYLVREAIEDCSLVYFWPSWYAPWLIESSNQWTINTISFLTCGLWWIKHTTHAARSSTYETSIKSKMKLVHSSIH